MANELNVNEQQYAAPEQELRSDAQVDEVAPLEPANTSTSDAPEIASREPSNDGAASSPGLNFVQNKNFKAFSYGDDGHQKKHELQADETAEAMNAMRDISLIAVGSNQIRANQNLVTRQAGNDDAHRSVRGQQELQRQLSEQKRIAAWNNAQTMVGGVSMTNAQAQAARKNVIENGDRYADWAIEKGYIKEEQREKFKQTAKEMYDLKEQEKINGKMTPQQEQRFESLRMSSEGQAVEKATVQSKQDLETRNDYDSLIRKQAAAEESAKTDLQSSVNKDNLIAAASDLNQKPSTTGSAANALSPTHINPAFSVKDDFFDAASPTAATAAPQPSPVASAPVTKPLGNTMG